MPTNPTKRAMFHLMLIVLTGGLWLPVAIIDQFRYQAKWNKAVRNRNNAFLNRWS